MGKLGFLFGVMILVGADAAAYGQIIECSTDPVPPSARRTQQVDVPAGQHQRDACIEADPPAPAYKTWCYVFDEYGRSGFCPGMGQSSCGAISWFARHAFFFTKKDPVHPERPIYLCLRIFNEHDKDIRYFHLYTDP